MRTSSLCGDKKGIDIVRRPASRCDRPVEPGVVYVCRVKIIQLLKEPATIYSSEEKLVEVKPLSLQAP